jgi:ADP-ribose pyrophosphatase YjhB (NUDIX family)
MMTVVKLLGLKRGIPPFVGGVAFPGGYNEHLETGQKAAARELFEELGVKTNPEDYEVFGNPLMSPTNNELIFYRYKIVLERESLKKSYAQKRHKIFC